MGTCGGGGAPPLLKVTSMSNKYITQQESFSNHGPFRPDLQETTAIEPTSRIWAELKGQLVVLQLWSLIGTKNVITERFYSPGMLTALSIMPRRSIKSGMQLKLQGYFNVVLYFLHPQKGLYC